MSDSCRAQERLSKEEARLDEAVARVFAKYGPDLKRFLADFERETRAAPALPGKPSARTSAEEAALRLDAANEVLCDMIVEYGCGCVPPHDDEGSSGPSCAERGHEPCLPHRLDDALHRTLAPEQTEGSSR